MIHPRRCTEGSTATRDIVRGETLWDMGPASKARRHLHCPGEQTCDAQPQDPLPYLAHFSEAPWCLQWARREGQSSFTHQGNGQCLLSLSIEPQSSPPCPCPLHTTPHSFHFTVYPCPVQTLPWSPLPPGWIQALVSELKDIHDHPDVTLHPQLSFCFLRERWVQWLWGCTHSHSHTHTHIHTDTH